MSRILSLVPYVPAANRLLLVEDFTRLYIYMYVCVCVCVWSISKMTEKIKKRKRKVLEVNPKNRKKRFK